MPPPTRQSSQEPLSEREVGQLFSDIREIKNTLKEITGIHAKEISDLQKEHAGLRSDLQKEISDLRIELVAVKVKMGIIATLSSLVGSGIITFIVNLLKDSPK